MPSREWIDRVDGVGAGSAGSAGSAVAGVEGIDRVLWKAAWIFCQAWRRGLQESVAFCSPTQFSSPTPPETRGRFEGHSLPRPSHENSVAFCSPAKSS